MGTRALINVNDEFYIYVHSDGYIKDGLGEALIKQFKEYKIVSGISLAEDNTKSANGFGCFAAQIVAFLKKDIGNVYLANANYADNVDYIYGFYLVDNKLHFYIRENRDFIYDGLLNYDENSTNQDLLLIS